MSTVVDGIMLPPHPRKDVHILIPKTCDYATLQAKRDFAGVIRDFTVVMRRLSWMIQKGQI